MDDPDDPVEMDLEEIDPLHPGMVYARSRKRQKRLLQLRRRKIRDVSNPFDVTYAAFVKVYRLSQDLTLSLIDVIRPYVSRTSSSQALPLELKVLAVLSFYASGSYQTPTGRQFDVAVGQSTLCAYIEEITTALNEDDVLARFIRFPSTIPEVEYCIERNRMLGGQISNVVGCTDGSLFKIMKPSLENNRAAFIGRKSFASINAQITCDRRLYIMNVLARFPGATNDSYIFSVSALRDRMQELYPQRRCHLLGDSGYALEPWMITPYARDDQPEEGTPEDRFNQAHCSDRNCVERCIGLLKMVWRCVNDERVLHYNYVKACRIILAVCVLHNLGRLGNMPLFVDDQELVNNNVNEGLPEELLFDEDLNDNILARGLAVRRELMEELEGRR